MTHLSPDEFVDAIDGTLTPGRRTHLASCAQCGAEYAALEHLLGEARAVSVPEPSPLFWEHLSRRIHEAVDDRAIGHEAVQPRIPRWFAWPVLAPVAALAVLIAALSSVVSQSTSPWVPGGATQGVVNADRSTDDLEARWAAMLDTLEDYEVDAAVEHGLFGRPWSADGAVSQLTAAEQQELVRLLNEELR